MARLIGTALLVATLAACGKPLVDQDYRGVPVATLRASITWNGSGAPPDAGRLSAALFFQPDLASVDPTTWREARGSTTPVPGVPAYITVNVFAAPDPSLLLPDAGCGVARMLVYADANANGRWDPGEDFLGIEPPFAWLYAPAPVDAARSPTGRALPAGFSHVVLPQNCRPPPFNPNDPGTCGVPLGAHCTQDSDCGPGTCLKETKFPWPAGYGTVAQTPDGGCQPSHAVYMASPQYALVPPGILGYWLKACSTSADCARPQDRDQDLYGCDVGLGACIGTEAPGGFGAPLPLGGRFEVEPFCATPLPQRP